MRHLPPLGHNINYFSITGTVLKRKEQGKNDLISIHQETIYSKKFYRVISMHIFKSVKPKIWTLIFTGIAILSDPEELIPRTGINHTDWLCHTLTRKIYL
jgi:hypothetical protein